MQELERVKVYIRKVNAAEQVPTDRMPFVEVYWFKAIWSLINLLHKGWLCILYQRIKLLRIQQKTTVVHLLQSQLRKRESWKKFQVMRAVPMKAKYDHQRNQRQRIVNSLFPFGTLLTKAGATKGPKSTKKKKAKSAPVESATALSQSASFVVDEIVSKGRVLSEGDEAEGDQVDGKRVRKRKSGKTEENKQKNSKSKSPIVREDDAAEEIAALTGTKPKKRKLEKKDKKESRSKGKNLAS
jgi:hypothetical protein